MPSVQSAAAYYYELTQFNNLPDSQAASSGYVYENTLFNNLPQSQDSSSAYSYEQTMFDPVTIKRSQASSYIYENTIAQNNPSELMVWDGIQWVHKPYYTWNGSAWAQIT